MIRKGHFWFVPANIKSYSALVTDLVEAKVKTRQGEAAVRALDPAEFWRRLAARDRAWLRSKGLPLAIAGTDACAFPGGSVRYDRNTGKAVVELDAAIAGPAYTAWVLAAYSLDAQSTVIIVRSAKQPTTQVGPPKPWY